MTWSNAIQVISASDRDGWLEARRSRITSTDVAKAMTPSGWRAVVDNKLFRIGPPDNVYFSHGRDREASIARAAAKQFGIQPSDHLYDGHNHSATPDGVHPDKPWLGEYKTSTKPLPKTTPRQYLDQVYMAQYVLDAERTLLGWEQHQNGVPVDLEPTWRWIERDDNRIAELLAKSAELTTYLTSEGMHLAY